MPLCNGILVNRWKLEVCYTAVVSLYLQRILKSHCCVVYFLLVSLCKLWYVLCLQIIDHSEIMKINNVKGFIFHVIAFGPFKIHAFKIPSKCCEYVPVTETANVMFTFSVNFRTCKYGTKVCEYDREKDSFLVGRIHTKAESEVCQKFAARTPRPLCLWYLSRLTSCPFLCPCKLKKGRRECVKDENWGVVSISKYDRARIVYTPHQTQLESFPLSNRRRSLFSTCSSCPRRYSSARPTLVSVLNFSPFHRKAIVHLPWSKFSGALVLRHVLL